MTEGAFVVSENTDAGILLLSSAVAPAGLELPAPNRRIGGDPLILWQSPRDWIFLTQAARRHDLLTSLRAATAGQTALVNDVSDARALFTISGDAAQKVIASGSSVGLPATPGWSVRTRFANLTVTLFDIPETVSFGLLFERPYAAYLRRWFAEAQHEFNIT